MLAPSNALFLVVWFPEQEHQHHLGTCLKRRFSGSVPRDSGLVSQEWGSKIGGR